jgi:hypothetical protein
MDVIVEFVVEKLFELIRRGWQRVRRKRVVEQHVQSPVVNGSDDPDSGHDRA